MFKIVLLLMLTFCKIASATYDLDEQISRIKSFKGEKELFIGRRPSEGIMEALYTYEAKNQKSRMHVFMDYQPDEKKNDGSFAFLEMDFTNKELWYKLQQNNISFEHIIFDYSVTKFLQGNFLAYLYLISNKNTRVYAEFDAVSIMSVTKENGYNSYEDCPVAFINDEVNLGMRVQNYGGTPEGIPEPVIMKGLSPLTPLRILGQQIGANEIHREFRKYIRDYAEVLFGDVVIYENQNYPYKVNNNQVRKMNFFEFSKPINVQCVITEPLL